MTRVLLVDDSATVRGRLRDALATPEFEVVGEATDGREAIDLCARLRPDIVSMDMMMPVMTGLAATEYIMAHCPTPILIVSASINRGEMFRTYDALEAGALDVVEKPDGIDPAWDASYRSALRIGARIRVITHPRGRLTPRAPRRPDAAPSGGPFDVVGLGASTGGPGALSTVIRGLPDSFELPVLFVLHISDPFGTSFAEWLDGLVSRRVRLARDREPIASLAGQVVMAPPDRHLVLHDGMVRLHDGPERHSCRPSVDVLFESLAREAGPRAITALLTGMGRDGAAGMAAVRQQGGHTIAQDEATSIVYGMPREAVLLDAASQVLPLDAIGPTVARLADEGGRG